MQFKEGSTFPTTYAFALVEHCQANLLRLRMFLAGEVIHINKDAVKSQRLLNMHSLITSSVSAVEKRLFSLKVSQSQHVQEINHVLVTFIPSCVGLKFSCIYLFVFYSLC